MTCPNHNDLSAFVEGGLSHSARGEIQGHIDTCPDCFQLIVELAKLNGPDVADESQAIGNDETMASVDGSLDMSPMGGMSRFGGGTMVGRLLDGRYLIGQVIGRGGFAEVYRATQLSVGRDVAIKVLSADLSTKPELITRFQAEAKIISRLKHPNILKLFDFGTTKDDRLYIVVELLEGKPVDHLLGHKPIEQRRLALWLKQVCGALQEAHSEGIYHRDLKPSNLFLETIGNQDFVKILDFGIAKIADTKQTTSGIIMGTPSYMSPEQIEALSIDHRTDLYSLGVIAFEALTGEPPFSGDTPVMVMYKHAKQTAPRIEDMNKDIHPALAMLVSKLLEKKAENRPTDAAEVVRYIDDIDWGSEQIPRLETSFNGPSVPGSTDIEMTPAPVEQSGASSELTRVDSPPSMLGREASPFAPAQLTTLDSLPSESPPAKSRSTFMPALLVGLPLVLICLWFFLWRDQVEPEGRTAPPVMGTQSTKPLTGKSANGIEDKAASAVKTGKIQPKVSPVIELVPDSSMAAKRPVKDAGLPERQAVAPKPVLAKRPSKKLPQTKSRKKARKQMRRAVVAARTASKRVPRKRAKAAPLKPSKRSAPIAVPKKVPAAQTPAKITIRLTPVMPSYEVGQTATLRGRVLDKNNDPLAKQPAISWQIKPAAIADLQKGRLKFKKPGPIKITGCVVGTQICKALSRVVASSD